MQQRCLPDCNSQHFYRLNAVPHFTEDCPSVDDATRRKMILTFENNIKTCLHHLVVNQIVRKRHRILPCFELLDEHKATSYVDGTTRTEQ